MVEFLEGRILSRYLLEKYSKNPAGWSFTVFPGRRAENGFGALVGSRDEIWRIQLDSIYNANPIILGAKADLDPEIIPKSKNPSYGYRRLDKKAILALLKAYDWEETNRALDRILSPLDPVAPKNNEAYAEGPIVVTSRKQVQPLVENQNELEDKLSLELKRLMKKRFSAYG
jgi:hypothetical protein